MSDGIWSALSGAVGQLAVLDAAAENVANANTPAYRAERTVFREHMVRANGSNGKPPKLAQQAMSHVSVDTIDNDTAAGPILATGRPLDCAIKDDSFFLVNTARGDRFSRLGNFHVAQNGTLVTKEGDVVFDRERKPIKVDPTSTDVAIGADGSVVDQGVSVGQLTVVKFKHPEALEREGAQLYKAVTGDPPVHATPSLEPTSLEQSNTSAVKGMVEIVNASRGFEACERVIDAFKNADSAAAMSIMKPS
jgi:flagellar basal-body rod protein FlgF